MTTLFTHVSELEQVSSFLANPACGFLSLIDDPRHVVGSKATGTLQESAIDNNGIDVGRRYGLYDRRLDVADRRDVDVFGAYENEIGAFSLGQRACDLAEAECLRAIYCRHLDDFVNAYRIFSFVLRALPRYAQVPSQTHHFEHVWRCNRRRI